MTTGGPDEGPRSQTAKDAAQQDWQRYGLSGRRVGEEAPTPDVAVRPIRPEDRHGAVPDDLFVEYRHENGVVKRKAERAPRSRRFMANVAAISAVGTVGVLIAVVAVATSAAMPAATPTPRITSPVLGRPPVTNTGTIAAATSKAAHVGLLVPLPSKFTAIDRGQTLDDGSYLYLTNADGGVSIDTAAGTVKTVFGGAPFATGSKREVVRSGLWVSNWTDSGTCGPACWANATTYRIDPSTGSVTRSLSATYLIGATSDAVWVAAGRRVERLDPATGAVLSSTPWAGAGEPRYGCNALWSYEVGTSGPAISQIDAQSGSVVGGSSLSPGLTYGPITVAAQCWMMNGQGGAELGGLSLALLKTDGTIQSVVQYPDKAVAIIDGEFWLYMPNGLIRRFEANSGTAYGTPYVLPIRPADDDPKWFFAAAGALWLIQDNQLAGFDIPTGASRVNG